MQLYIVHSSQFDYQQELYAPLQKADALRAYSLVFPHEISQEPMHSRDIIQASEAIIAEVSYPSTGMGIELAWAYDSNKPIICLHQANKSPSSSIRLLTNEFISYDNSQTMVSMLASKLRNLLPL